VLSFQETALQWKQQKSLDLAIKFEIIKACRNIVTSEITKHTIYYFNTLENVKKRIKIA
jgi:hypothetical protein